MTRLSPGLDPEISEFLARMTDAGSRFPDPSAVSIEAARRTFALIRREWSHGGPVTHKVNDRTIPGPTRAIPVRTYYPSGESAPSILIYLHGGGWTFPSVDTHDRIMREYVLAANVAVVGVDYALAPENKFPAALDECVAVTKWFAEHGASLGVNPSRIAIAGDSSGANLALATCIALRDSGSSPVQAAILNYGVYDSDLERRSYKLYGDGTYLLTTERMKWFWNNYVTAGTDRSRPLTCPLKAELHDLPPTFLVISELDVLHDENVEMAQRLRRAGNVTEAHIYPGTIHAFLEAVRIADVSKKAVTDASAWLREIFEK